VGGCGRGGRGEGFLRAEGESERRATGGGRRGAGPALLCVRHINGSVALFPLLFQVYFQLRHE
jgi:hypothetical protein